LHFYGFLSCNQVENPPVVASKKIGTLSVKVQLEGATHFLSGVEVNLA
jgi:hypothetical protein